MVPTRPLLKRHFGRLKALALNDRHLPPCAINPNVPRDVSGRATQAAVFLEGVEAVIEWIIDLSFNQPAANPKSADAIAY